MTEDIVKKFDLLKNLQYCKFILFSDKNPSSGLLDAKSAGLIHLENVKCFSCEKEIIKYGKAVEKEAKKENKDDDDEEKAIPAEKIGEYYCPVQQKDEKKGEEEEELCFCKDCKINVSLGFPFGNGNVEKYALYCAEKLQQQMHDEEEALIFANSSKRADGLWENENGFLSLVEKNLREKRFKLEKRQNELAIVEKEHEFVVRLFTPSAKPLEIGYSRSNPPSSYIRISAKEQEIEEELLEKELRERNESDADLSQKKAIDLHRDVVAALDFRADMRRVFFDTESQTLESRYLKVYLKCRDLFEKESNQRPCFKELRDLQEKKQHRLEDKSFVIVRDIDDIYLITEETKKFEFRGNDAACALLKNCIDPKISDEKAYDGVPLSDLVQYKLIRDGEFICNEQNCNGTLRFFYVRLQDGDCRKQKKRTDKKE